MSKLLVNTSALLEPTFNSSWGGKASSYNRACPVEHRPATHPTSDCLDAAGAVAMIEWALLPVDPPYILLVMILILLGP